MNKPISIESKLLTFLHEINQLKDSTPGQAALLGSNEHSGGRLVVHLPFQGQFQTFFLDEGDIEKWPQTILAIKAHLERES